MRQPFKNFPNVKLKSHNTGTNLLIISPLFSFCAWEAKRRLAYEFSHNKNKGREMADVWLKITRRLIGVLDSVWQGPLRGESCSVQNVNLRRESWWRSKRDQAAGLTRVCKDGSEMEEIVGEGVMEALEIRLIACMWAKKGRDWEDSVVVQRK